MSGDFDSKMRQIIFEAIDLMEKPPHVPDGFATPFPHDEFPRLLVDAIRASFADLRARLSGESMYGYFLWLSPECRSVVAAATSEENLDRVVARYTQGGKYRARAGDLAALQRVSLRWSVADDWLLSDQPYFDQVNKIIDDVWLGCQDSFCDGYFGRLVEMSCLAALARVDAEHLFGRGHQRDELTINLTFVDETDEDLLAKAKLLNPSTPSDRYQQDLKLQTIAYANLEYLGSGK